MIEYDMERAGLLLHIVKEADAHGTVYKPIADAAKAELREMMVDPEVREAEEAAKVDEAARREAEIVAKAEAQHRFREAEEEKERRKQTRAASAEVEAGRRI